MVRPAPDCCPRPGPRITCRPGEIVIDHPELFSEGAEELCLKFLNRALHVPDVAAVEVDRLGRATIFLNPDVDRPTDALKAVAASLRAPEPFIENRAIGRFRFPVGERFIAARRSDWLKDISPELGSEVLGLATDGHSTAPAPSRGQIVRGAYGVLAVGSLGMAWVGLVTPGIPIVPFVLLSSFCAIRSSPALHARIKRSKVFGRMLLDWEQHRAISRRVKRFAIFSTLVVTTMTMIVVSGNPLLLALSAVFGVMGLTIVLLFPTVDPGARTRRTLVSP